MTIQQLRYFLAVARIRNFTRAAQDEQVAQPSLSQQIRKLEDELGTKLFDRTGRNVRLTRFGEVFQIRANAIFREMAAARSEISEMLSLQRGRITVGVIPTVAPYCLPRAVAEFCRCYPAVSIDVVEDLTASLTRQLHEGTIDVAVLALPVSSPGLTIIPIHEEPLLVALPTGHRLATRNSVALSELDHEPFLLLKEGHCFRENALSACRKVHLKPNVVFESGQFSSLLAMVRAGMGVTLVPKMALGEQDGRDCKFIQLSGKGMNRTIAVAFCKTHFVGKLLDAFIQVLRQQFTTRKVESSSVAISNPVRVASAG